MNEITTDEDCMHSAQNTQGDLNDLINEVDGKNYVQALSELEQIKENVTAIETYLTEKAKEVTNG